MSAIYLTIFFASSSALIILILWYIRKLKYRQTQLRLLRGRRHILDQQISAQTAAIQAIDGSRIDALRKQADGALDALNVELVERQAHLLNYADLVHLQDYKIQLCNGEINESSTPPPLPTDTKKGADTIPRKNREEPSREEAPKGRNQIENQLLKKIGQINKGK